MSRDTSVSRILRLHNRNSITNRSHRVDLVPVCEAVVRVDDIIERRDNCLVSLL